VKEAVGSILDFAPRKLIRPGLVLLLTQDAEQLGCAAAEVVAKRLLAKPTSVLALPTGRTPIGMYRFLAEMCRQGQISFHSATTFNLDEFVGLEPSHPGSYHTYMRRHLLDHVDADPARVHIPAGDAPCLDCECDRYESEISRAGGLDLAVLGIGENGHIGFNEPGSPLDSRTRVVALTPSSRAANAHLFACPEDVPQQAITMGVGTILEARRLLLLASGPAKADALYRALHGPIASASPASAIQLHPNVVVIADTTAAARLPEIAT